jgi:protein-tyrosine phosphatase
MFGMVDLHSHHLPALDDGPKRVDDAVAQVNRLGSAGYRCLVTTPHIIEGHYEYGLDEIRRRVDELQTLAGPAAPELRPGAEHRFDERFLDLLERRELVPLGGAGDVILLEFAWPKLPPTILDVLYRVQLKGYTVLLAHPDRYDNDDGDVERLAEFVERGGLLQVELGSLTGVYGQTARRHAQQLLADDLVEVVAGDVHKPADVDTHVLAGLQALEHEVGPQRAERLAVTQPARLIGLRA